MQQAVRAGYRHLDCAQIYGNEKEIGDALQELFKEGVVKREELFITSKIWNTNHKPEHVKAAAESIVANLQCEYLDLALVHFPIAFEFGGDAAKPGVSKKDDKGRIVLDDETPLHVTWGGMEKLVEDGLARSIGISNYSLRETRDCLAYTSKIPPAVNQLEVHAHFSRRSLVDYCNERGVSVTAHTPLGGGAANKELFGTVSALEEETVKELAAKLGRSPAQVLLRWCLQRGMVVIPKSTKETRIIENGQVFDFELDEEAMAALDKLDKGPGAMGRTNKPHSFWGWDVFA